MTKIELCRKALKSVTGQTFECSIYSSEGGRCGDSYNNDECITFSKKELLFLLKQKINNDNIFKNIKTEDVDVDKRIEEIAYESAWPDGGPEAQVHGCIPNELEDLSSKLDEIDEADDEAVANMRERLKSIQDGDYTFIFDIYDGNSDYCFDEDVEETIHLKAKEIRWLLHNKHSNLKFFNRMCRKSLDEDFINAKAEEKGFAKDHDYMSYGGSCDELSNYLESWCKLIGKILCGEVTEENLDQEIETLSM